MEIYNDRKNGGQRKTPKKDNNDVDEEDDAMDFEEDQIWILQLLCVHICIA